MSISSITGGILAAYAVRGLSEATSLLETSTQRLTSGSRITRPGDDVAALSTATALKSQITSLRQATLNTSQAGSFLQVASGGVSEIIDMLERMKAVAVQANSGSLTSDERIFLNQEFQALSAEIDSIAQSTNFNGIALLNGSISGENAVGTTASAAMRATGSITLTANASDGDVIIINGVTFTATTTGATGAFDVGASIADTVENLAILLNNSTDAAVSSATYTAMGNTLQITYDAGGTIGNQFTIDQGNSDVTFTTAGNALQGNDIYSLQGGANNGLNTGSVIGHGTIGDSILTAQNQVAAFATLTFTDTLTEIADNDTLQIDDGEGGMVTFTFKDTATASTDIQIGGTNQETLANAVEALNAYSGADDYGVRALEFRREDTTLIITHRTTGNALDTTGAALSISENTGGTLSSGTLNNGATGGVNTSGITNPAFVGTINNITATYLSNDQLTLNTTIGGYTYTATVSDTTPAANTTIRFSSTTDGGGFFDIQLAAGQGSSVANQAQANTYAARINAAMGGLTFTQNRIASSFTAAGDLANASFEFRLDDFSDVTLDKIAITAAPGAGMDAILEFSVNGTIFRSQGGLGDTLYSGDVIRLVNLEDGNQFITFRNGDTDIDLSSAGNADDFEADLRAAFGLGSGSGSVSFQIGSASTDQIAISIGSATTDRLFKGANINVLTQLSAATAEGVLDDAINTAIGIQAGIGSLQSRLDYASSYLSSAITSIDAARGVLEDTDIAHEATSYAVAAVRQQAAISVLAQVNSLPSSLLTLLQNGL